MLKYDLRNRTWVYEQTQTQKLEVFPYEMIIIATQNGTTINCCKCIYFDYLKQWQKPSGFNKTKISHFCTKPSKNAAKV